MPIKQIFTEPTAPLTFEEWIATLTEEEQAAFAAAEADRLAAVQTQVDLGNLTIDTIMVDTEDGGQRENLNGYIWADGANPASVVIPAWEVFFNRYNQEYGINFVEDIQDV